VKSPSWPGWFEPPGKIDHDIFQIITRIPCDFFAHVLLVSAILLLLPAASAEPIPLPEHPRPDAERAEWINLNGAWQLAFDSADTGEAERWYADANTFDRRITVPFPWGSPLSGVQDEADIAWYRRTVTVPEAWQGRRVFLVVGACDWHTKGWLDGQALGSHQGGYTPFEFELTEKVRPGAAQQLVLRVDDRPHAFKLYGKQGYGEAKGIWQTVYLEARGPAFLRTFHFTPDIDRGVVRVAVEPTGHWSRKPSSNSPSGCLRAGTSAARTASGVNSKNSRPISRSTKSGSGTWTIPGSTRRNSF
jgi:hypothetical protein